VNATQRNPVHTYAETGTYTVSLTATNDAGSDTHTETGYIAVSEQPQAPVAAFTASPQSGTAPLTVTFTDASTGDPTGWAWNFGDGSAVNATQRNPVHTFTDPGTFDVSLTVTSAAGSDTETRTGYITVGSQPAVTAVSPATGPVAGGTLVTITGSGFTGATAVRFGETAGSGMTVVSGERITVRSPAHAAGSVYITVTTPGGTSPQTAAARFTYDSRPTITALSPLTGPTTGGTLVTITGSGLSGATGVRFGGIAGTGMTVVSGTQITVRSPARAAGTVNVTVTTPAGTNVPSSAARFTYLPRPTVTGVSPDAGPTTGGTLVTVTGTGFTGPTVVKFGGVAGTGLTVLSPTQISVRSPAHAAGTVNITVTTLNGTNANTTTNRFTYVLPPAVTAVSPASGSTSGGTLVTITGTGLATARTVRFDGIAGTGMTVISASRITVRSPAHAAGTVNVTVSTAGGTSANSTANRFTYIAQPAGYIANHTRTHLSAVPLSAITAAKANLHIA
jgi:PKD repeat protein